MEKVLFIDATNDCYSIHQINNTMTIGELIEHLSQYDENMKVYLRFDKGYTYGSMNEDKLFTHEVTGEDE